jgi:hypothetical protein
MGAEQFCVVAHGKTAQDAFNRAVDAAAYEYGHGGYTGSIAEKHEYALVQVPDDFPQIKVPLLVQWAQSVFLVEPDELKDTRKRRKQWSTYERLVQIGTTWYLMPKAVPPKWRPLVARWSGYGDDKWGPAVCVELKGKAARVNDHGRRRGDKTFLFWGWASS